MEYTLFFIYILCFSIIYILKYFNNSLESVQYYHNRLISGFEQSDCINLKCLKYCCITSILYSDVYFLHFLKYIPEINSNIRIIQGLDYFNKITKTGAVFETDNEIVFSFLSTSNISDTLYGYDSNMIDIDSGMVHSGFYKKANCLYTSVLFIIHEMKILEKLKQKTLILTGHSLGGAIASILSILLNNDFNIPIKVITFGSPKWGNCQINKFIKKSKIDILNYVNTADFVVSKPIFPKYIRIGKTIDKHIDTGNNNVNHGIKVYKEIVLNNSGKDIPRRKCRTDEILFQFLINFFGN